MTKEFRLLRHYSNGLLKLYLEIRMHNFWNKCQCLYTQEGQKVEPWACVRDNLHVTKTFCPVRESRPLGPVLPRCIVETCWLWWYPNSMVVDLRRPTIESCLCIARPTRYFFLRGNVENSLCRCAFHTWWRQRLYIIFDNQIVFLIKKHHYYAFSSNIMLYTDLGNTDDNFPQKSATQIWRVSKVTRSTVIHCLYVTAAIMSASYVDCDNAIRSVVPGHYIFCNCPIYNWHLKDCKSFAVNSRDMRL